MVNIHSRTVRWWVLCKCLLGPGFSFSLRSSSLELEDTYSDAGQRCCSASVYFLFAEERVNVPSIRYFFSSFFCFCTSLTYKGKPNIIHNFMNLHFIQTSKEISTLCPIGSEFLRKDVTQNLSPSPRLCKIPLHFSSSIFLDIPQFMLTMIFSFLTWFTVIQLTSFHSHCVLGSCFIKPLIICP